MGTAIGDLTAITINLGYSMVVFAVLIAVPAFGYWRLKWNPILAFWIAYVVTRPLSASFADWVGKPRSGLGWGDGKATSLLALLIVALVAFLAITRRDVQNVMLSEPGQQLDRIHPLQ
jgi:uncharacterized membrane-anchored protein